METMIAVLSFLAISSHAFTQEVQSDARNHYELHAKRITNANQGAIPQRFIPHPFFNPRPFFIPRPFSMPAPLPPPRSPPLPPVPAPLNQHSAHDSSGSCMDELRSFSWTRKSVVISSACCSTLHDVKIPPVHWIVSQYCSGA